uniref:Long-chain-fatty-acid--CoA ligase n=1 Tax=Sinocyclocheilus grahami TaxID=75366 RepID=A0A672K5F5_SINGR
MRPVQIELLYTHLALSFFLSSSGLCILLRVKFFMHHYIRTRSTVPSIFAQRVALHPDKAALVEESTGEVWSFSELDRRSNAVAQWAVAQGWRSGDVVAVFMESRPLMVALWLGLAKVGVEPALINFNLRRDPLMHCMGVSGARGMVFGAELLDGETRTDLLVCSDVMLFQRPLEMFRKKCVHDLKVEKNSKLT